MRFFNASLGAKAFPFKLSFKHGISNISFYFGGGLVELFFKDEFSSEGEGLL